MPPECERNAKKLLTITHENLFICKFANRNFPIQFKNTPHEEISGPPEQHPRTTPVESSETHSRECNNGRIFSFLYIQFKCLPVRLCPNWLAAAAAAVVVGALAASWLAGTVAINFFSRFSNKFNCVIIRRLWYWNMNYFCPRG